MSSSTTTSLVTICHGSVFELYQDKMPEGWSEVATEDQAFRGIDYAASCKSGKLFFDTLAALVCAHSYAGVFTTHRRKLMNLLKDLKIV